MVRLEASRGVAAPEVPFGDVEGRRPQTRRIDRVAGAERDGGLFLETLPREIGRKRGGAGNIARRRGRAPHIRVRIGHGTYSRLTLNRSVRKSPSYLKLP